MNKAPPSVIQRRQLLAATGIALTGLHQAAWGQAAAFPARPIRLVVGYAPGGSVDFAARVAADILQAKMGATVVVENVSGAAGTIAAQKVVASEPDGYTLLAGSSNEMAATKQVNPAQRYNPVTDMTPVSLIATAPVILAASPQSGVRNIDDFIAVCKKNPGKYSYGSSGVGSTLHFVGELIKQQAGLFIVHIPYRGTAALTTDLVSGSLDFAILSPTAAAPFLQTNRITPLGISSKNRLKGLPQVPALDEHKAFKGFDLMGWFGLAAPKGLPPAIEQALRQALQAGLAEPEFRNRLEQGGALPATGQENFARLISNDSERYAALVKFANIQP